MPQGKGDDQESQKNNQQDQVYRRGHRLPPDRPTDDLDDKTCQDKDTPEYESERQFPWFGEQRHVWGSFIQLDKYR